MANLTHVIVARDGSYVALGSIGNFSEEDPGKVGAAIWESADGRSWHRNQLGLPPDFLIGAQVVAGDKGYLLAGNRLDDGQWKGELWQSVDGRAWKLVYEMPQVETTGSVVYFQGLAAGREGFVVAISTTHDADYSLNVIASGDGQEWFEAPPIAGVGPGAQVASLGRDWVMATPETPIPFWFSANGLDWESVTPLGFDAAAAPELGRLVSTGDRVFLNLYHVVDPTAEPPRDVWSSGDGTIWHEVGAGADFYLAGAASSGTTMVLAGDTPEGAVFVVRSGVRP